MFVETSHTLVGLDLLIALTSMLLCSYLADFRLPQFNARNLANAVWALAKLNHNPVTLLPKMVQAILTTIHDFNSQHIGNTMWALGILGEERLHTTSVRIFSFFVIQDPQCPGELFQEH